MTKTTTHKLNGGEGEKMNSRSPFLPLPLQKIFFKYTFYSLEEVKVIQYYG